MKTNLATRFAIIRIKWFVCFACFSAGWLSCAAWVFLCAAAPDIARDLIARVM